MQDDADAASADAPYADALLDDVAAAIYFRHAMPSYFFFRCYAERC